MAACPFADQIVLHRLLVSHLFDKSGNLLHGGLDLSHDSFLAIQCRLFVTTLDRSKHLHLLVEPGPHLFLILHPERRLVLKLSAQVFVHLAEHGGRRVTRFLDPLLSRNLVFAKTNELVQLSLSGLLQGLEQ